MVSYQLSHFPTRYLYNRDGIFYFRRKVPIDLQGHYQSKVICTSLRTSAFSIAARGVSVMASQLEAHWMTLRLNRGALTTSQKIIQSITFSEALKIYIRLKGPSKPSTFVTGATRNVNYLVDAIEDKELTLYTSIDAGKLRDYLMGKGLASSSIKRIFSSIKAIYNLAAAEYGLGTDNPFSNVYFPEANDIKKRQPVSTGDLIKIKRICHEIDDEIRWLIALISDTGMRLSEAAGLYWEDINLDGDIPYLIVRPNSHRRLKTINSERIIPLTGMSLWAINRAKITNGKLFVFPKYMKGDSCNANSASAAANKWVKSQVQSDVTIHSFRHSMRDRLRAIQCPAEVIDQIGGWSTGTVGSQYGNGYPIDVLHEWMIRM